MAKKGKKQWKKTHEDWLMEIHGIVGSIGRAPLSTEITTSLSNYIRSLSETGIYEDGLRVINITPLTKEEKHLIGMDRTKTKWKMRILETYKELNRVPRIVEMYNKYGRHISSNLKYRDLIEELGYKYEYEKPNCEVMSRQEIMDGYKKLCSQLGYNATADDINMCDYLPCASSVIRKFNSLYELRQCAGMISNTEAFYKYDKKELEEIIIDFFKSKQGCDKIKQKDLEEYFKNNFRSKVGFPTIKRYFQVENMSELIEKII